MNKEDVYQLMDVFSKLNEESLNGDPMSFKGKFVCPYGEDEILKISSTYDANGDLEILEAAKKEGIEFYVQPTVMYQEMITILTQPKLEIVPEDHFKFHPKRSLNCWAGDNATEDLISKLVYLEYGEKEWNKILAFNTKWHIGNIRWANIGFNEEGKIQCFDFFCGLSRNEQGYYYV